MNQALKNQGNTMLALNQLSPGDAWKPWQPEAGNPWSLKWAAHLYRRAAFGSPPHDPAAGAWEGLQRAVKDGPEATLDRLFAAGPDLAAFDQMMNDVAPRMARQDGRFRRFGVETPNHEIVAWWLYGIVYSPHPLRERLTLFWHNHFATSIAKVRQAELMLKQNQTLRDLALGKFRPLLLAVSRDPAMLLWLDSNSNVKAYPNENYARELFELFSLGVGNYTEKDIKEAARAFTGWHTDGQDFAFNQAQHDGGAKTVLGQSGNLDGGDIVRIALEMPACARFLVRKLYRQFISETEPPPDALLEPLADQLRQSEYDIGAVVRTMLRSRLFFSEHAYRKRIKAPVEYAVGLFRSLGGQVSLEALAANLDGLGQNLFAPPNVKGWDGGKAWLNSATLLARHNLAWSLVGSDTITVADRNPFGGGSTSHELKLKHLDLIKEHGGQEPAGQVAFLLDLFLQGDVNPQAHKKLAAFLADGSPKEKDWENRVRETAHTILLMPEYQMA